MSQELAHRRPQSVADAQTVDYTKALNYLGLSPGQPAAQALILVCQRYDLDPLLGHVTIYEGKPYVHYSAYLHIGNASPHYQGAECVREWDDDTYYYATVRVHRDDRSFYAERTGKSRKIKKKRDGSTYVDEHADAKAFAQAHRRALRLAFNVAAPDPEDDGVETPAPEPVTEVVRMVEATSGVVGEREAPELQVQGLDRHDPTTPGHQSDPWGLAPPAPGSDQTSPPSAAPGKRSGGGGPVVSTSGGGEDDVTPDDGEGSEGSGVSADTDTSAADGTATTGPAPPNDRSPVMAWCEDHGQDIRVARAYLRRSHPREFPDLRDRKDLEELRPPRSDEAIRYLDVWYHQATETT